MALYLGENKIAGGVIGDVVKRQILTAFTVTTNSSGYAAVPSDIKPTLPTNATLLGYFINTWQSTSPAAAFNVTNNGAWVVSAPNVTINGLQLSVLYKIPGMGAEAAEEPKILQSISELLPYLQTAGATKSFVCNGTVTSYLTNGLVSFVGKFNAFRVSDEYIDWFGTVSNGMYCGRLSRSGAYQSHRVIAAVT